MRRTIDTSFFALALFAATSAHAQEGAREADVPSDDAEESRGATATLAEVVVAPVVVAPVILQPLSPPVAIGAAWRGFRVLHTPLHEATTGTVDIRFTIEAPDRAGSIVVRWRDEEDVVREVEVHATPSGYEARLDGVAPPSFDYWVVSVASGREGPIFASEPEPQRVLVHDGPRVEQERHGLAGVGGHRSALAASFEWVDFGHRQVGISAGLPDEYWHASAGYAYSFFDIVETIRFEFDSFRGASGDIAGARRGLMVGAHEVGLDYGRAEITWYIIPLLRLRTSGIFGFSQRGFEGGGAGDLVIGDPSRVSVELGATGITGLGITARARLGFLALPILPLGASLEVTNFPAGEDFGVRLLVDVGVVIYPGALLRVRGGYQSRTAVTGGATIGGDVVFAF